MKSIDSPKKNILVIYHSQGGTMKLLANQLAKGAAREDNLNIILKEASDATVDDLLNCNGIAIGSPEYFGTMAGMIKDFFDRTYEAAQEKTIGLPFIVFVSAGNDGRGAISQIERLTAGYKWKKVQEAYRVVGVPTEQDIINIQDLGHALAAGVDFGIF
ncbi:MAG: flavodoxin [Desulfobulbaceae bacterium]|nr:flavodoxin [Desulfobulbaceae bacterium]